MNGEFIASSMRRGMILLQQKRYSEAEKYFCEALSSEPNHPLALYHLAICKVNQGRTQEALKTAEHALTLEPEASMLHALRAFILVKLQRANDALAAAAEALRLDPDSDYAFTAQADAYFSKNEWSKVEFSARQALAINPENNLAANQLAHALRLQNRLHESEGQTAYMLSQDPENAGNHTTAGWTALQKGDYRTAEKHFLEALRLDAQSKFARAGLKESYKARSPIYRWYLNYCFFMQRFTTRKRWLLLVGMVVVVQFLPILLPVYLLFVLWMHVARGVGNFQIFFDRVARHALTMGEKLEAFFVGGEVLAGIPLVLAGLLLNNMPSLILGTTFIFASLPFAHTFTNDSRAGRFLFGATGFYVLAIGGVKFALALVKPPGDSLVDGLTLSALVAVVLTTWLCNMPALKSRST